MSSNKIYQITEGPDKGRWVIRDWDGILSVFGEVAPDLFHAFFSASGFERTWEVLRCRFGIGKMSDLSGAYLSAMAESAIAQKIGVSVPDVERVIQGATEGWRKYVAVSSGEKSSPAIVAAREMEGGPDDDASFRDKLKEYGFEKEDDADVLKFLRGRFDDLKDWLESSADSTTAVGLVQDEVMLRFVVSPQIQKYRRAMRDALNDNKQPNSADQSAVDTLQIRSKKLNESIAQAKEALNIGEEETGGIALRNAIGKNVTTLIDAHRAFYSDGNNAFVDGVFTVAQVEILAKPHGDRPLMYRGDLPLLMKQMRDGLWDKDFVLQGVPRTRFRAFSKAFRAAMDAALDEEQLRVTYLGDSDEDEDVAGGEVVESANPIEPSDIQDAAPDSGSGGSMCF
jgi:hypothetical protein